uniref:uncharacterized protein LOC120887411 n=1 Tax=Ictidomys tridecemlineatus TaxID=43179 RepID=UPI001A9F2AAC|nr:uncharacterized protein LOC120887411 [Ictidomys tridecemlineatus]
MLWIPGFATLAAPLYLLLKGNAQFQCNPEHQQAFDNIKRALLSAPALALPDVEKPFTLYIEEKKGIARGVLTQTLGPWRRPIAYLSKKLDPGASGWPHCLKAIAAAALLIKDADKLTLEQKLTVIAPHALESIIHQPPDRWLSNSRITHYQSLLLDKDRIILGPPAALNPATLLPEQSSEPVTHDCQHILAEETSIQWDLKDQPLPHPEVIWFTDGSSFLQDGKRWAGATIVSRTKVIWSSSLPEGTSAQKAELIALTKVLELVAGKKATIYTDSRYAFATAHLYGAIYQQRGLLTSAGKEIKNRDEILRLLSAIQSPKELAIVHCPGHQKGNDPVAVGKRRADKEAKLAALNRVTMLTLSIRGKYESRDLTTSEHPDNLTSEDTDTELLENTEPNLQFQKALHYVKNVHQLTHLGSKKLQAFLKDQEQSFPLTGSQRKKLAERVTKACRVCQLVNAYPSKLPIGRHLRGTRPGQFWEMDFTEIKPSRYGLKYLLIFVDTFSGWIEAFPTKKEMAQMVVKKILEDIFPRYGLPKT